MVPRIFSLLIGALVLALMVIPAIVSIADEPRLLTEIAQVRALSRKEAERSLPVQIRGVITWHSLNKDGSFVVDDGRVGIAVDLFVAVQRGLIKGTDFPQDQYNPGAVVEVAGISDPGGYAPVVLPLKIRRVGTAPLPEARHAPLARLLSGSEDASRVTVQGVVQDVTNDLGNGLAMLTLIVDGQPCRAMVEDGRGLRGMSLVDALVQVTGVLAPTFNLRSEATGLKINAMAPENIEILTPPPADPFLAPRAGLDRLFPFAPDMQAFHRKVTRGVVTFADPGRFFFLQDGAVGIRVESRTASVQPGELVDVVGFVDTTHIPASLRGALTRSLGRGALPVAGLVSAATIVHPRFRYAFQRAAVEDYSGRLVRVQGELHRIEPGNSARPSMLQIDSDGQIFSVILPVATPLLPSAWVQGAKVEIMGVCELDFQGDALLEDSLPVAGFRLWLRSPTDIAVLRTPSWWTPLRLSVALWTAGGFLVAALAWSVTLHRTLQRRTETLEEVMRTHRDVELEFTSTRKERLRLAADLHDGLKRHLAAASFRVEAAAGHLPHAPDKAVLQLETAHNTLIRTQTDLEECLWGLNAVAEGPPDFVQLLEHVTSRAEHWPPGVVTIESEGTPRQLTRTIDGSLLLLFQEATNNALRHGEATHIEVMVSYGVEALDLRIADNGKGFNPGAVPGSRAGHFGIDGMKKRMHWLGGTLHLNRRPGGGMEIHAVLPWSATSEARDLPEIAAGQGTWPGDWQKA